LAIVFITAEIEGWKIYSHQLAILPIYDLLKQEGFDCRWGIWWGTWGRCPGIKDEDIDFFVTGDEGVRGKELNRIFFHPHGLHHSEDSRAFPEWKGYLSPGSYWLGRRDALKNAKFFPADPWWTPRPDNMPITGWVKMDALFKKTREQVISEYGLNLPYDKTVLYAPTGDWHWASSFDKSIEHILNLFSRLPYNLIIKTSVRSESFRKWRYFNDFFNNPHPNHMQRIKEAHKKDVTPLYLVSDLVITDGSSIAWEFIGTDKPLIQLNNMLDPSSALVPGYGTCYYCAINNKPAEMKKYFSYDECKVCGGTIKCSLEELEQTIIEGIENPNLYANERRVWANLVNKYVDGHCAERCVKEIKRIAGI